MLARSSGRFFPQPPGQHERITKAVSHLTSRALCPTTAMEYRHTLHQPCISRVRGMFPLDTPTVPYHMQRSLEREHESRFLPCQRPGLSVSQPSSRDFLTSTSTFQTHIPPLSVERRTENAAKCIILPARSSPGRRAKGTSNRSVLRSWRVVIPVEVGAGTGRWCQAESHGLSSGSVSS